MGKLFASIPFVAFSLASYSNSAPPTDIPPGAAAFGYTKCVIDERPRVEDIAPGDKGKYKWFSRGWWHKQVSLDHYIMEEGVLAIKLEGELVSTPRDFSKGLLPVLPGKDGFYVEFEARLSDNDPDHWPALWLMPVEHNMRKEDHYPGDPEGFQRWMELDVDEGGFGPGMCGTVHNWWGIYPNYQHLQNPNNIVPTPLDRTMWHTFGVSFDPITLTVCWWLDGELQMTATAPYVPEVGRRQNFYLIISAQSHGAGKDYRLLVRRVRAFVPQTSSLPPATLK